MPAGTGDARWDALLAGIAQWLAGIAQWLAGIAQWLAGIAQWLAGRDSFPAPSVCQLGWARPSAGSASPGAPTGSPQCDRWVLNTDHAPPEIRPARLADRPLSHAPPLRESDYEW
jgi:hypothetical protein